MIKEVFYRAAAPLLGGAVAWGFSGSAALGLTLVAALAVGQLVQALQQRSTAAGVSPDAPAA